MVLLLFPVSQLEAIDAQHALLRFVLLVVLSDVPLLKVGAGDQPVEEVLLLFELAHLGLLLLRGEVALVEFRVEPIPATTCIDHLRLGHTPLLLLLVYELICEVALTTCIVVVSEAIGDVFVVLKRDAELLPHGLVNKYSLT